MLLFKLQLGFNIGLNVVVFLKWIHTSELHELHKVQSIAIHKYCKRDLLNFGLGEDIVNFGRIGFLPKTKLS